VRKMIQKKIGILTFHYSTNFGGVLQSYALFRFLEQRVNGVEIIDYVPSTYIGHKFYRNIGLKNDSNVKHVLKRLMIKGKFCSRAVRRFDDFRAHSVVLSRRVDESTLRSWLNNYDMVVVGSDQVWSPGQRAEPAYFLGFEEFKGKRISYAADSTTAMVEEEYFPKLRRELGKFDRISVRNEHSQEFVAALTGQKPPVVVDPTLLWDFKELVDEPWTTIEPYILVYVLGEDIDGSNRKAIQKIKQVYGDLKVYAVVIPTMKFNICDYADKVFYDLGPEDWLNMIRNAAFVYTDSFHGAIFSLKFHKPFLAYYSEEMRATRFIDVGKRYKIAKYIVTSVDEIDAKGSLLQPPDFKLVDHIIEEHRDSSVRFLREALEMES